MLHFLAFVGLPLSSFSVTSTSVATVGFGAVSAGLSVGGGLSFLAAAVVSRQSGASA